MTPENVTPQVIRDAETMVGDHGKRFSAAPTAGSTLTAAQQRVLTRVELTELPFISRVLLFSKELERLGKTDQRIVWSLIKGGHLLVFKMPGPLPSERASDIGYGGASHYILASPRMFIGT